LTGLRDANVMARAGQFSEPESLTRSRGGAGAALSTWRVGEDLLFQPIDTWKVEAIGPDGE
jgi:hypothetical protein